MGYFIDLSVSYFSYFLMLSMDHGWWHIGGGGGVGDGVNGGHADK